MIRVHNPALRHDFIFTFDVTDGNPNGDPDAGNLPRVDPETMQGIVTDVSLKRRIRNFVALVSTDDSDEMRAARNKIFVEHNSVLNEHIRRAYVAEGLATVAPASVTVPATLQEEMVSARKLLPDGFRMDADGNTVTYSGELTPAELKLGLDEVEEKLSAPARVLLEKLARQVGKPDKSYANAERARRWMCANFYDVRMFGAVMSTGLNAGQVRGPLQLTFGRSVDPVLPQDLTITRVAVTAEADREKLRTIGHKTIIPYGYYVVRGFFNPHLAAATGVDAYDMELFWSALLGMWDVDRSAGRGLMALRKLYIFTHDRKLGNAPANILFEKITIRRGAGITVPRSAGDYDVHIDEDLPSGVTLTSLANY